jgi:O-antigen ligase
MTPIFNKHFYKLLSFFFIFIAWPSINFAGLNITFILFILIAKYFNDHSIKLFDSISNLSRIFILFGICAVISSINAPKMDRFFDNEFFEYKIIIQQIFWIIISLFIIQNLKNFSYYKISEFLFYGIILLNLNFYFFNISAPPPFKFNLNRNTYVFIMVALFPIVSYYVYHKFGLSKLKLFIPLILILVLFSNGRAGALLILGEVILMYGIFYKSATKFFKVLIFTIIISNIFISQFIDIDQLRKEASKPFAQISPRISELISGEGDAGDLETDRSWLIRELMIEKGFEIAKKYPFLGIGLFNFSNYDAQLDALYNNETFSARLYGYSKGADQYNDKSAHNSYVQLICENGILGFIIYLIIALPLIIHFFKKIIVNNISFEDGPLMSFFFLSIYFYAIASLMGTLTYIIIGMAYVSKNKQIKF